MAPSMLGFCSDQVYDESLVACIANHRIENGTDAEYESENIQWISRTFLGL